MENICLKIGPDIILDWTSAWAWLQIPGLRVNRRMFHVAANYRHNILHFTPDVSGDQWPRSAPASSSLTSSHLSRTDTRI